MNPDRGVTPEGNFSGADGGTDVLVGRYLLLLVAVGYTQRTWDS